MFKHTNTTNSTNNTNNYNMVYYYEIEIIPNNIISNGFLNHATAPDLEEDSLLLPDVLCCFTDIKMCNNDEEDEEDDEEEDEEDDENSSNNYNSHDAFIEWFDENIETIEDIEERGDSYLDVIITWCINNNHEYRDNGVYNMNI